MTIVETRSRLESLVRENLDMVYASALRQVKDPHVAADVTQAVFLILQRKLPEMNDRVVMEAWLLRTTRYACLDAAKRARRRTHHETKAAASRSEVTQMQSDISPLIDEALDQLPQADRTAIVLAYYHKRSYEEIANRLGIGREAAHKRVQRALGKLRTILTKRGVSLPAMGITAGLTLLANPAAAPAAVEQVVIYGLAGQSSAMAQAIAKGTMIMMKLMKFKTLGLFLAVGILILATAALLPARTQAMSEKEAEARATTPAAIEEFAVEKIVTVVDDSIRREIVVTDLDTGKTFTPPRDLNINPLFAPAWIESQGADVLYKSAPSTQALIGIDMAICPMGAGAYEQMDAKQMDARYILRSLVDSTSATPAVMSVRSLPSTFLFRTREGGVGVLQLMETVQEPPSVKLRMKLLTNTARDAAAADTVQRDLLPEMVKLTARLDAATDPGDVSLAIRELARGADNIAELMKGTSARPANTRLLGAATRLMSERLDDKQPEKAKEHIEDLRKALELMKNEVEKVKAGA